MNRPLERYINNIGKWFNHSTNKDEYTFYGDGQGDFEEIGNSASKEIVKSYIKECQKQIELAKEYLKEIK